MAEERGKTVLVLGAGATRACSFVDPSNWPCLPPLDRDFFTQLQRVPDEKHQEAIAEVIKDVTNMFGTNFDVTLENVFSTVEHTIRMLSVTRSSRAYNRRDLEGMRDRLLAAIAIVMEAALAERADNGRARHAGHPCDYHTQLVRDVLEPGDHIISFNYDCVIDSALKECGSKKWNARYGYGFDLGPRGANLEGDEAWQPETPATKGSTIHLHKVHGSLHFQFADGDKGVGKRQKIKLKKRPYTKQKGTPRYSIIPPESNKPYDKGILRGCGATPPRRWDRPGI